MSIQTITPEQLQHQKPNSPLIDVRTAPEFFAVHASNAVNIPLDQIDPVAVSKLHGTDEPLYIICKMGGRSMKACEKFVAAGITNVVNVDGGTDGWVAAGLPVARSESKVMPLDCQVRVLAGSIVAIGAILALIANPYWAILSAFIGCGLVFSGITNTCGMGVMLSKMPWNQVRKTTSPSLPVSNAAGACDSGG